jgi:hypothetical protein
MIICLKLNKYDCILVIRKQLLGRVFDSLPMIGRNLNISLGVKMPSSALDSKYLIMKYVQIT